ncbi:hypothetical protein HK096_004172, partial [Nowakowskiella sp. JEL0078]
LAVVDHAKKESVRKEIYTQQLAAGNGNGIKTSAPPITKRIVRSHSTKLIEISDSDSEIESNPWKLQDTKTSFNVTANHHLNSKAADLFLPPPSSEAQQWWETEVDETWIPREGDATNPFYAEKNSTQFQPIKPTVLHTSPKKTPPPPPPSKSIATILKPLNSVGVVQATRLVGEHKDVTHFETQVKEENVAKDVSTNVVGDDNSNGKTTKTVNPPVGLAEIIARGSTQQSVQPRQIRQVEIESESDGEEPVITGVAALAAKFSQM